MDISLTAAWASLWRPPSRAPWGVLALALATAPSTAEMPITFVNGALMAGLAPSATGSLPRSRIWRRT